MELDEIQSLQQKFIDERSWDRFTSAQIFTHLIEEIGEIGSYILYDERYKVEGIGHKKNINLDELTQEFAQVLNLFIQLANRYNINLSKAWKIEFDKNQTRFSKDEWQKLAKNEDKSRNQF